MNIDNLQDAPGVYAVQLPDGVVKFGQSKTVKSRVRTHVRTLRSYGVPVLDVAAVYVNHCEDAEKDLFARLTAAGYQRSSNSRESYIIPWDVATGMLNPLPRLTHLRFSECDSWIQSDHNSKWHLKSPDRVGESAINDLNMDCAVCGWTMVHLVRVNQWTTRDDRPAAGLWFQCENSCPPFCVEFTNHKGENRVTTIIHPEIEVAA